MIPSDPKARHDVWWAFSELFLDTDVRLHYVFAANHLAQSPYTLAELRQILDAEVTPALQYNLFDIAGEWSGFSQEKVVREVEAALRNPPPVRSGVDMSSHWRVLETLIRILRHDPSSLAMLRSILPLYLERNASPAPCREYSIEDQETMFRQRLGPLLLEGCAELHKSSPEVYPSLFEIAENWRRYARAWNEQS